MAFAICRKRQGGRLFSMSKILNFIAMKALVVFSMMMFPTPGPQTTMVGHSAVDAFTSAHSFRQKQAPLAKIILAASSDNHEDDNSLNDDMESMVDQNKFLLSQRLISLRAQILEEEMTQRPPNPNLEAVEFIKALLSSLMHTDHPLPDSCCYRFLILCSEPRRREALRNSIGTPVGANEELMVSSLSRSIPRPHNQFGILVDSGD